MEKLQAQLRLLQMLQAHVADIERDGDLHPEDEAAVAQRLKAIVGQYVRKEKVWGRSKLMILGQGRAGKTSLVNAVLNRADLNGGNASTVGIEEFSCTVDFAQAGRDTWEEEQQAAESDRFRMGLLAQVQKGDVAEEGAGDPKKTDGERSSILSPSIGILSPTSSFIPSASLSASMSDETMAAFPSPADETTKALHTLGVDVPLEQIMKVCVRVCVCVCVCLCEYTSGQSPCVYCDTQALSRWLVDFVV
jgi:hypothetical protein